MYFSAVSKFLRASWPGRPPLPDEDIFGNVKKIRLILRELKSYREKLGRDLSVLDFGCGNAVGVGQYLIGEGINYVGVDFHEPSLSFARQHFGGANAKFLDAVPMDQTFDVIIFADVLEHVPDPLAIVLAYSKQLAPGGMMIWSMPNGYGPCEIEKFVDRHLRLYQTLRFVKRAALHLAGRSIQVLPSVPYNNDSGHIVFFTMRSVKQLARDAGYRIVRYGHGGFVGADLTGNTIFTSRRSIECNIRVADRLPSWMVSNWYFILVKADVP
jgi:SAM-dependent methyltransferase